MNLVIRDARPDDAVGIVDVLNPIIESGCYTVLDKVFTEDEERRFIVGFPTRGIFHVAERIEDRRILGFQNLEPFASFTHAFDHVGVLGTFVDLEYRRKGIGRQLFEATFSAAVKKGYEKLFTYIRADNRAALQSYLKQGFQIVGTARRHARVGDRYVDSVMVEKFL